MSGSVFLSSEQINSLFQEDGELPDQLLADDANNSSPRFAENGPTQFPSCDIQQKTKKLNKQAVNKVIKTLLEKQQEQDKEIVILRNQLQNEKKMSNKDKIKQENENLQSQLKSLQESYRDLSSQMENLLTKHKDIIKENEKLYNEYLKMEIDYKEMQNTLREKESQYQSELKRQQCEYDNNTKKLNQKLIINDQTIVKLREDNQKLQMRLNEYKQQEIRSLYSNSQYKSNEVQSSIRYQPMTHQFDQFPKKHQSIGQSSQQVQSQIQYLQHQVSKQNLIGQQKQNQQQLKKVSSKGLPNPKGMIGSSSPSLLFPHSLSKTQSFFNNAKVFNNQSRKL